MIRHCIIARALGNQCIDTRVQEWSHFTQRQSGDDDATEALAVCEYTISDTVPKHLLVTGSKAVDSGVAISN